MTWTLKSHTINTPFAYTSPGIDSTGADLIVIAIAWGNGGGAISPTDNYSNTWTATVFGGAFFQNSVKLWYSQHPTVGTGHTVTFGSGEGNVRFSVEAWSGSAISSFDQNSGSSGNNPISSVQPGSITPTANGELLISACDVYNSGAHISSVDSGFTIVDQCDGGEGGSATFGLGMAYLVQSAAAAINPTWTQNSTYMQAVIASFKAGVGGPTFIARPPLIVPQAINRAGTY